ncbi:MAG: Txe/YoeB family addiction module toxin [Clostridiales Family XIII bacterium]|jgi:toxin YoeB|nr:Txe/YoeB family addiction module toxin [Clostridiales Family XIII bacterium]
MSVYFSDNAWADYTYWQTEDRKTVKKINKLIADMVRGGYAGIGHPELLAGDLSGFASRKIDEKNRIIYRVSAAGRIEIVQCRGHYGDK